MHRKNNKKTLLLPGELVRKIFTLFWISPKLLLCKGVQMSGNNGWRHFTTRKQVMLTSVVPHIMSCSEVPLLHARLIRAAGCRLQAAAAWHLRNQPECCPPATWQQRHNIQLAMAPAFQMYWIPAICQPILPMSRQWRWSGEMDGACCQSYWLTRHSHVGQAHMAQQFSGAWVALYKMQWAQVETLVSWWDTSFYMLVCPLISPCIPPWRSVLTSLRRRRRKEEE